MLIIQGTKLLSYSIFWFSNTSSRMGRHSFAGCKGLPWKQGSGWRLWLKSPFSTQKKLQRCKGYFSSPSSPFPPNLSLLGSAVKADTKLSSGSQFSCNSVQSWNGLAHTEQCRFSSGLFLLPSVPPSPFLLPFVIMALPSLCLIPISHRTAPSRSVHNRPPLDEPSLCPKMAGKEIERIRGKVLKEPLPPPPPHPDTARCHGAWPPGESRSNTP